MSVPQPVQNVINDNEEVLFTGQYSLANRTIKIVNDVDGKLSLFTSAIPFELSINPGYNLYVANSYPVVNNLIPPSNFISRNFSLSSFKGGDLNTIIGQVTANALYFDEGSSLTNSGVTRYYVTGGEGIYENVTSIIISYEGGVTAPRDIFFIGKVCYCDI
jgi:hypothetical protein